MKTNESDDIATKTDERNQPGDNSAFGKAKQQQQANTDKTNQQQNKTQQ